MKKTFFLLFFLASVFCFSQAKVQGLITDYQTLSSAKTANISSNFDGNYFTVKDNNTYSIADTSGLVVKGVIRDGGLLSPQFKVFGGKYIEYSKKDLRNRIVNLNKKIKTDFIYSDVYVFPNNTFIAYNSDYKKGGYTYFDKSMNKIFKLRKGYYSFINLYLGSFNDGLSRILNNGKVSYMNEQGQIKIKTEYSKGSDFSEGYAVVGGYDGYGYIDITGKLVIPRKYSKLPYLFKSGLAKVQSKDGKYGFIDKSDKVIIEPKYDYATCFYKNYALVRKNSESPIELIDVKGKVIQSFGSKYRINFSYNKPKHSSGSSVEISELNKINSTLKELVDYKKGIFYKYGSRGFSFHNFYGVLNIDGSIALDFKYSDLKDYNNGFMLATIYDGDDIKQGLINDKGRFVVVVEESKF